MTSTSANSVRNSDDSSSHKSCNDKVDVEAEGKIVMQKYRLGRLLGKGTFAKVHFARCLQTDKCVAIKTICKEKVLKVGLKEQIMREILAMKRIVHPNVVQLYEVMASRTKIYFVMEYVKGVELFQKVAAGGRLRERVAHRYFQQLISAVDYCHSRGVYHRDLKPENILIDENDNLKILDFGLGALNECRQADGLLHTSCGTPAYVSPEVISKKGYDGAKADVWSCGCILYVLVSGALPFNGENIIELYKNISNAQYKCPSWFSPRLKRILKSILEPNPAKRITIEDLKERSWFQYGPDDGVRSADGMPRRECVAAEDGVLKKDQKTMTVPNLNAFDIISFSTGLNLSGFFDEGESNKTSHFTSTCSAPKIVEKLEDMAKQLKLRVNKDEDSIKIETRREGRKGPLKLEAEIFEIAPSHHLVGLKKTSGDTLEYRRLLEERVRPALKDIVCVWQGDRHEAVSA